MLHYIFTYYIILWPFSLLHVTWIILKYVSVVIVIFINLILFWTIWYIYRPGSIPELNAGPFPAKFPYRNEFEPNICVGGTSDRNGEIPSLLNNRKRSADEVIQGGEDTVKKVTARRGRPVKGTVSDGMFNVMPDILGGNRIYDLNNFRNNGEINDRNYNSENHGNQLPESTLYRVDHNGNYEAVMNTGGTTIVQPKILKKPRKQNNNNPKTIRIYKNKKDANNNNLLSTNEENEKNVQNNNLNNNNLTQSRGDKSEINAMDALFWALDQQENIKLKQLEKDKEKDKEIVKVKEKNNERNDIGDNNDIKINGKFECNTKEEEEKDDDNVNNNSDHSNDSNNQIETNEKFENYSKIEISSENEKIIENENGDEEEKVGYEISKNEMNRRKDNDEMDIELK